MSHVTEKLAEFIFEELSAAEMTQAQQHLTGCSNCREQVERFQKTLTMLQAAPDLEPPRNIVFEFEKPAANRFWRWFPAMAALAAVLLVTVALVGRVHMQWHDSQLTVAFGQPVAPQADQTAELATELQRVKGYIALLESRQQRVERDQIVIAAKLPPSTAGRSPAGD